MSRRAVTRLILLVTVVGLAVAAALHLAARPTATSVALTLVAVVPLVPMLREMVEKLRRRQLGVDVIALLAVAGALGLGEFLTAAIVGLMLATGQYLEEYAAGRAERDLTSLIKRAPQVAHRVEDGGVETVEISQVGPGDRLMVKAGDVIPVDGIVLDGPALVDGSALTGEPLPVEHRRGDRVSSGAVNAADVFHIQAVAGAEESTYAGIVRLVREARQSRAPSVRLADRWAAWFVPLTLVVSGLAWAISGDPIRALAVLVVATPCPLLLAVPIAIVSGISRGAKQGIVFRGGGSLERLAQVSNILIDKTGTVTVGRPSMHSIVTFDGGLGEDEVLSLAASVDQTSSHVLARTIVEAANQRGLELAIPGEVSEVAGAGLSGRVNGRTVSVGRLDWMLDGRPEPKQIADFRRRMSRVAPTAVYVAVDGEVTAAITFDDKVRPDAVATIRALRRSGISRIVMATGDQQVVARSVGMAVGVDEVLAECTPAGKVDALGDLRARGVTAMVGDGINDAPALAAADVGVAMGARGATASSEAADVVLMEDRLDKLVVGIEIAKRSRRIAVESVVIGMGLSMGAMGVASFGLIAPIVGALIQEGIDVISMANSLRALRGRPHARERHAISPELSRRLRQDHDRLMPRLDSIRDAADRLDLVAPAEARRELAAIEDFLMSEVLPHEEQDEDEVYPQVSAALPGDDPMAAMSHTHREIFHLIDVFRRQMSEVPADRLEEEDIRRLRRTLYSLHAVLSLHFDQEEELYLTLQGH